MFLFRSSKNCGCYPGVAMATYSFHRLIMGKVEFDNFCCLIFFHRYVNIGKSCKFHMTFVQIA